MKAVGYTHCHPVDQWDALLDLDLRDPPMPRGHDLLVEVRAVSVNPVDTKLRRLEDPVGEPRVLGFDAAGVVRAIGPDCTLFGPGDLVYYAGDLKRPGSNAELQLVDERIVGLKPRSLSFAEAAALPLTTMTAWEGLFDRLRIPRGGGAGDALLMISGAGGVGSMVVQLARRLTALRVIATASRPESREWCLSLGAHDVVDHAGDIPAQLRSLGLDGVRYIFSAASTPRNWKVMVEAVVPQGQVLLIEGPEVIDARDMSRKSVSIHWELMFTRPLFGTPDMIEQHHLLNQVARMVDAKQIRTTMTRRLAPINAETLREAHALVESGRMVGKVVLEGF